MLKISVFSDMTLCGMVISYRRFGGACCRHHVTDVSVELAVDIM